MISGRHVAGLIAANHRIVVRCEKCQHSKEVAPDVLDMTFRADFDVYAGYRELEAQLRCERCGERHRRIDIVDRFGSRWRWSGSVAPADFCQLAEAIAVAHDGRQQVG